MNMLERNEKLKKFFDDAMTILDRKGKDYNPSGEAFTDIIENAKAMGVKPEQVLLVFMSKHWAAIVSHGKSGQLASEPIEERCKDLANYCAMYSIFAQSEKRTIPFVGTGKFVKLNKKETPEYNLVANSGSSEDECGTQTPRSQSTQFAKGGEGAGGQGGEGTSGAIKNYSHLIGEEVLVYSDLIFKAIIIRIHVTNNIILRVRFCNFGEDFYREESFYIQQCRTLEGKILE